MDEEYSYYYRAVIDGCVVLYAMETSTDDPRYEEITKDEYIALKAEMAPINNDATEADLLEALAELGVIS